MWKKWLKVLGGLIVQYGPGLVQAIFKAKADKAAAEPQAPPADIEK